MGSGLKTFPLTYGQWIANPPISVQGHGSKVAINIIIIGPGHSNYCIGPGFLTLPLLYGPRVPVPLLYGSRVLNSAITVWAHGS